jgi:uncharacterized protein YggU (UPF0235/DUF167 family)
LNDLLDILKAKGLNLLASESNKESLLFECLVFAKPGSKVEKVIISNEGHFIVQTKARPIEGEANKAIVEMIGKVLGTSKSNVELVRGDKSKLKKIKVLVQISTNKDKKFFQEKFTSILKQEV